MNAMKTQFSFHLFPTVTIAVWSIRRERKGKTLALRNCISVALILIIPRSVSNSFAKVFVSKLYQHKLEDEKYFLKD